MLTKTILILGVIFSQWSMAANAKQAYPVQSISVNANGVIYQCQPVGGGGGNPVLQPNMCNGVIAGTEARYTACKQSSSSMYCFTNTWMKLKANDPNNCWYQAFTSCLDACKESASSAYCFNQCQ